MAGRTARGRWLSFSAIHRRRPATRERSASPLWRRLRFEPLEDRRLLANVTVGNGNDVVNGNVASIAALVATPGPDGISLREAILAANADVSADTIDFSVTGTIQLTNVGHAGEIVINNSLTINGPGANLLTIRAFDPTPSTKNADGSRIFMIDDGAMAALTVSISGLTLTGGDVAGNGGAIFNRENLAIASSTISGNSASFQGGGIYNRGGALTVTGSTVSTNHAGYGGGILGRDGGSVTVSGTTIVSNGVDPSSNGNGGGIEVIFTTLTVSNSTISGNWARGGGGVQGGGGILSYVSTTNINHSTITGNVTNVVGGGILVSGGTVTLNHTIVAGNMRGATPDDISGAVTANFSLISATTGATITGANNILNQDPMLGPLTDNGGLTTTRALLPGSPAIDAGDPAFAPPPANDQRGAPFVRVYDGDEIPGARIDIGAYELQAVADSFLVVNTLADEYDGNYSASDLSLREAIGLANFGIGANTITFAEALSGETIILGLTQLVITEALTIDARPLAANVTINTNQQSRIFNFTAPTGNFTLGGLTLTGCRTQGNNVNLIDRTFSGGAIRSMTTGNLIIDQCTVSGNSTGGNYASGGGIFANGAATITGSTVSGNFTEGGSAFGGGIFAVGAVTLTGSTVSGNSAVGAGAYGGGIITNSDVTLTGSTVTNNHAIAKGGGVFQISSGHFSINGSIAAGNTAGGGGADIDKFAGTLTVTVNYSVIGTGVVPNAGGNNIFTNNPQLGPLADNGGPTFTHALLPGSPAIDAGNPGFVPPPIFDQRGAPFVRVFDGDGTGGARIDIGAFELQPPPAPGLLGDYNEDDAVNAADYVVWRKASSLGLADLPNDTNDAGLVGAAEYALWRAHFGNTLPAGGVGYETSVGGEVGSAEAYGVLSRVEPVTREASFVAGSVTSGTGLVEAGSSSAAKLVRAKDSRSVRPRQDAASLLLRDDALLAWLAARGVDVDARQGSDAVRRGGKSADEWRATTLDGVEDMFAESAVTAVEALVR